MSSILQEPFNNHGTAFDDKSRQRYKLRGLLPHKIDNIKEQTQRCIQCLRNKSSELDKFSYLYSIKNSNLTLFYQLALEYSEELLPVIYTPNIANVCSNWSLLYLNAEGIYLSYEDEDHLEEILSNYPADKIDISVITDGSRILGLGDIGFNGMPICIGKLCLYSLMGGIRPDRSVPIHIDLGTNNETLLEDPFYMGSKKKRKSDREFYSFLDKLMTALDKRWPGLVTQFEDFSTDHAFGTLDRYRQNYPTFNDDIQGTGAVILAGFINAAKIVLKDGVQPKDHRLLFYGAGSAGVGVAKQVLSYFDLHHIDREEAKKKIYFVDSKGLVTHDRGDVLAEHKKYFARSDNNKQQLQSLLDIVHYVKPTAIFGLSGIGKAFNQQVLEAMKSVADERASSLGQSCGHPIIFPLSNPATSSECTAEEAWKATNLTAIFASGSPFPSYKQNNKTYYPSQGNNHYVFPALGLSMVLSKAKTLSDSMVLASALSLAESVTAHEKEEGRLYPHIDRARQVCIEDVTPAIIRQAMREGCDRLPEHLRGCNDHDLRDFVVKNAYYPSYE